MIHEIRRVISEADDMDETNGREGPPQQQHEELQNRQQPPRAFRGMVAGISGGANNERASDNARSDHPLSPGQSNYLAASYGQEFAIVEPDHLDSVMDVDDAPLQLIDDKRRSESLTPSSSLSDASSAAQDNMDDEEDNDAIIEQTIDEGTPLSADQEVAVLNSNLKLPPPLKQSHTTNFQRLDSVNDSGSESHKASSQNSSRDWGWFEDVHQSSDFGSLLRYHPHHPMKRDYSGSVSRNETRQVGLMPQVSRAEVEQLIHHLNDSDASAMAVTAPTYVLEESLSSQLLWKDTAGQRPPQPVEERAFFEKMWAQNFARSQVDYRMPVEVLTATSPISLDPFADGNFEGTMMMGDGAITNYDYVGGTSGPSADGEAALVSRLHGTGENGRLTLVNKKVKGTGSDGDLTILIRGDNVFGTTVSKSFARASEYGGPIQGVDTVNISIASYRVVESKKYGKYAQFLVIYREGSIRDTVGIWKRYRDFEELANKVTHAHEGCAAVIANMSPLAITEEPDTEHLPNAITSWRLLKKRQRWYRCLDAGYLSLKVFLLERFLHDILFESSSPKLLRSFVSAEGAFK